MPEYELCYFAIRGLAETSRMLFAMAKVPYKDTRLTLDLPNGDFSKIIRPEFEAMKEKGELDVTMGKVPFLAVDGVKFGQSKAIEQYLAKQFGFMGSSDIEAAQVMQVAESIRDLKDAYQKAKTTDEDKAKWFAEGMPEFCGKLEKSFPKASGPWLVGSKVSYADLVVYQTMAVHEGAFFDNLDGAKAAWASCPRISAAMAAIAEIPELKEWIANRPKSPF
ncbi:Glutathione S-transferase domain protein [Amphidinium carterae]